MQLHPRIIVWVEMMATPKKVNVVDSGSLFAIGIRPGILGLVCLLVVLPMARSQSTPAPESHLPRFQRLYTEARNHWRAHTNDATAGWQFARACFDWADFAKNDTERAERAEEGIAVSRQAIALDAKSAGAQYYLGLNLGQLAQTKLWGALKLIDGMEAALKKSIELDAKFDYAGAHRSLTLLYRDAPGWPTSVGSRSKARQHLQKILELAPEYPGNQICHLESQLKWGETKTVRTRIPAVEEQLKTARVKFTGEQWRRDWEEWDERWEKVRAKAGMPSTNSPAQSSPPR